MLREPEPPAEQDPPTEPEMDMQSAFRAPQFGLGEH
jgi:hypothetical protein